MPTRPAKAREETSAAPTRPPDALPTARKIVAQLLHLLPRRGCGMVMDDVDSNYIIDVGASATIDGLRDLKPRQDLASHNERSTVHAP